MAYDQGSTVRCTDTMTQGGTPVDLSPLHFVCVKPDQTEIAYTYGTDTQLVRVSAGVYTVDVLADQSGAYHYRFYSTGNGAGSSQSWFAVTADTLT